MTITIADLANCIRTNAINLVEGSLSISEDGESINFQVKEMYTHDVKTEIIDGVIVDTADGTDYHYADLEVYGAFLRCEE